MHRERNPDGGVDPDRRPPEPLGRDADDGVPLTVDRDGGPGNGWISAEPRAPEVVADDGHGVGARRGIFVRQKRPPSRDGDSERLKVIAGHERAHQALRRLAALGRQMHLGRKSRRDGRE